MTELKRSVAPVDQESLTSSSKCQKVDASMSSKAAHIRPSIVSDFPYYTEFTRHRVDELHKIERKEKLGEKITALQELVSPYGKTDTASVLLEAMDYIRFLHEQVKVLSAPYLYNTPATNMEVPGHYSLRSKGLCLVPVSYTDKLARNNGADLWAPIKTTPPNV